MMKRLFPFLILPLATVAAYVHFECTKRVIDIAIAWCGFSALAPIAVSNITSMLEVAIGVNLALSFLTSFSNFIGEIFAAAVNEFEPEKNATFLEAMKEAVAETSKELATELDVERLQKKYYLHVTEQIQDFRSDALNSANLMKTLGAITAILGFILLIGAAKNAALTLPLFVFWMLVLGLVMPIATHVVTLGWQYFLYSLSIRGVTKGRNGEVYRAFINNVRAIYKKKKAQNANIIVQQINDVLTPSTAKPN